MLVTLGACLLPPTKIIVGCCWVYIMKIGPDGNTDHFKAFLVAKGYTFYLDYGDTFSSWPISPLFVSFLLWSLSAISHFTSLILRMPSCITNQPPSFIVSGESHLVCRLCCSRYNLKWSPQAWFGHFSSALLKFGMTRCEANHSLFSLHSPSGRFIYLVVYIDDSVITSDDSNDIHQLKSHLHSKF
ncbi:hypothetical protein CR513_37235, partial [Mucuna pruriens]